MPHFYINPNNITGHTFILTGSEFHHLTNVLRCKVGATIQLFDGTGKIYTGKIEQIGKNEIKGIIINKKELKLTNVRVNLFQSIPKGDRFDWLIEKSVELGINSITPLITERSLLKQVSISKFKRWERISIAASKQCNRTDLMNINSVLNFSSAIKNIQDNSLNLIPWEGENKKTINDLKENISNFSEVNILIGPEGGFTLKEIDDAINKRIIPITLGQRILRVETAGLLSSILMLNLFNEFSI